MAKQDDWIRITLRLPSDLHSKLVDAASNSSMNAEIVARLDASFTQPPASYGGDVTAQMEALVERVIEKLQANEAKKKEPKK